MEQALLSQFTFNFRAIVNGNRINIPDASAVSMASAALRVTGAPGTVGVPMVIDAGMLDTQITPIVQQALADVFAGGVTDTVKTYQDIVYVVGHTVVDAGPVGLSDALPGDEYGNFNSNLRGQDNAYEGIYLDDFIIGFAERGEMATSATGNEHLLRQFPDAGVSDSGGCLSAGDPAEPRSTAITTDMLELARSFDTNLRLSESISLVAPAANEISDGQTFTLYDGVNTLTFEFDDVTINDGVTPGNVEIPFNPQQFDFFTGDVRPQTATVIAQRIRDAINSSGHAGGAEDHGWLGRRCD